VGKKLLSHPANSLDLVPSDYHLLRSMAHFLQGINFQVIEEVDSGIHKFFVPRSGIWYHQGIIALAKK